jgi:glycosyltransferase involved in cell wall biosynthesis
MLIDFLWSEYSSGYKVRNPITPLDDPSGISGTEINLLGTAWAMARKGHNVYIYGNYSQNHVDELGIHYYKISEGPKRFSDVAFAYHDGKMLPSWTTSFRICQHQTFYALPFDEERADLYLSATNFNKNFHRSRMNETWDVLPNACDAGKFEPWNPIPGKMVFHTSPERGLHVLLRVLPKIAARVPHAHLHIFSNRALDILNNPNTPVSDDQRVTIDEIKHGLQVCRDLITIHGSQSRNSILKELSTCSIFAYPSEPPVPCEVFPVSVMDCCAAGVPVVLSPSDGIHEVLRDLILTPSPPTLFEEEFIEETVRVMTDQVRANEVSEIGKRWISQFSFDRCARELENLIYEYKPRAPSIIRTSRRIAFVYPERNVLHPFPDVDQLTSHKRGLTGSEKAMFGYATALAKLGHEVTAFGPFSAPGNYKGVTCLKNSDMGNYVNKQWDHALAMNDPFLLQDFSDVGVRSVNQQLNSFPIPGWEKGLIDIAFTPSASLVKHHSRESFNCWRVLYNGCDPTTFSPRPFSSRSFKIIHISSPDRGLHRLLEMYPRLKQKFPSITLDIYYEWNNYYRCCRDSFDHNGWRSRYINMALRDLERLGVKHYSSTSCDRIADILSRSRMMVFPLEPFCYTEGFSVATLECAVAGCLPIIPADEAIPEVYGGYLPLPPAPFTDHQDEFFECVVQHLSDDHLYAKNAKRAMGLGKMYDWNHLVKDLIPYI